MKKYRKFAVIFACISVLLFITMVISALLIQPIGINPEDPEKNIYDDFDSGLIGFLFLSCVGFLCLTYLYYKKYCKIKISLIIAEEKQRKELAEAEQKKQIIETRRKEQELLAEIHRKENERLIEQRRKREENFNNYFSQIEREKIIYNKEFVHRNLLIKDLDVDFNQLKTNTNIIRLLNFVVVDVETTGLYANPNTIVQLTAIRFTDFKPTNILSTYINPLKAIPAEATKINGITDDMVKDAPVFDWIINSLDNFVGKATIVGHNLAFDLKFLYKHGYDFKKHKRFYFDTYSISRTMDKDSSSHKLDSLCSEHGILLPNAHNSEYDAFATGLLFIDYIREKIDLDETIYPRIKY